MQLSKLLNKALAIKLFSFHTFRPSASQKKENINYLYATVLGGLILVVGSDIHQWVTVFGVIFSVISFMMYIGSKKSMFEISTASDSIKSKYNEDAEKILNAIEKASLLYSQGEGI